MYYEFYGKYKWVRNKTWKFIIDFKICRLPVSIMKIGLILGIEFSTYQDARNRLIDLGIYHLCSSTEAFTLFIKGKYYIFYNDNILPRQRIRFSLAHELGHFVLGHKMKSIKTAYGKALYSTRNTSEWTDDILETEANIFASRLLAPACVLWELNIHSVKQIQELCGLSEQAAEIRVERMEVLYEREIAFNRQGLKGPFLLHPLERKVFKQFEIFIKKYREEK